MNEGCICFARRERKRRRKIVNEKEEKNK